MSTPTVMVQKDCHQDYYRDHHRRSDSPILVAVKTTEDVGRNILNNVNHEGQRNSDKICEAKFASVKATEDVARDILNNVNHESRRNGDQILDAKFEAVKATENTTRSVLLGEKDILLSLCHSNGELKNQIDKSAGETNKQLFYLQNSLDKQLAELKLQAEKDKSCLLIENIKSTNEIDKKMAEHCCALKEQINCRADKTDALIGSQEKECLKAQLHKAENEILMNTIVNRILGDPCACRPVVAASR